MNSYKEMLFTATGRYGIDLLSSLFSVERQTVLAQIRMDVEENYPACKELSLIK